MGTQIIISAIQTVILGITGGIVWWYTKETQRLREISQKQLETMLCPFLLFIDEIIDENRNLYVENTGSGPALNIVRVVIQPGVMLTATPNEPLLVRVLGPRQKTYSYATTQLPNNPIPLLDDPDLKILIEYDDIFGNHYQTQYMNRQHSIRQVAQRAYPPGQAARI